jgi:hypothetical protein
MPDTPQRRIPPPVVRFHPTRMITNSPFRASEPLSSFKRLSLRQTISTIISLIAAKGLFSCNIDIASNVFYFKGLALRFALWHLDARFRTTLISIGIHLCRIRDCDDFDGIATKHKLNMYRPYRLCRFRGVSGRRVQLLMH